MFDCHYGRSVCHVSLECLVIVEDRYTVYFAASICIVQREVSTANSLNKEEKIMYKILSPDIKPPFL